MTVSVMGLAGCNGNAGDVKSPSAPEDILDASSQRAEAAMGVLEHHASRGMRTVMTLYRRDYGYRLELTRDYAGGCPRRDLFDVKGAHIATLETLWASLTSESVARESPCTIYLMDGSGWSVGTREKGEAVWRTRDWGGRKKSAECAAFEASCESLMHMVGLTCGAMACTFANESDGLPWCPDFPARYLHERAGVARDDGGVDVLGGER